MSDPIDDALAAVAPKILQPELRELEPGERIVRTGGLKFILPTKWKTGDVLTEEDAIFMNAAFHTALINRFGPQRKALMERDDVTYEMLDKELQAHFESFSVNTRANDTSDGTDTGLNDEDKALVAFGRPLFAKVYGGTGLARKDYEELLREWVFSNRSMLMTQMVKHQQTMTSLTEGLADALGET